MNTETELHQSADPLLTPPEAAAYIGVTENTLSVWRCVGRYNIQFVKVGRLVNIVNPHWMLSLFAVLSVVKHKLCLRNPFVLHDK